jgi:hypothetical protein
MKVPQRDNPRKMALDFVEGDLLNSLITIISFGNLTVCMSSLKYMLY